MVPEQDKEAILQPAADIRVLVVDDDRATRETLCAALVMLGYVPIDADGGWEAVRLLRSSIAVDIIVCDVVMPGMDEFELARRARSLRGDIPLVLVTGYSTAADDVLASGAVALIKPFSIEALGGVLGEIRPGKERSDRAAHGPGGRYGPTVGD